MPTQVSNILLLSPRKGFSPAFALPAVLIVATVMLVVLLSAVQSSVSTNQSVGTQYVQKLAKTAADSGIAMAKWCYQNNGSVVTWTNQRLLKPNTDCTGADLFNCPTSSTNAACYVLTSTGYRTKFTVGVIYNGTTPSDFDTVGIVEELRKTSQAPVNRITYSTKTNLGVPAGTYTTY